MYIHFFLEYKLIKNVQYKNVQNKYILFKYCNKFLYPHFIFNNL